MGSPADPDPTVDGGTPGGGSIDAAPEAPPTLGLRAEYFADYVDKVEERLEPVVDVDWGDGVIESPAGHDHFSIVTELGQPGTPLARAILGQIEAVRAAAGRVAR